MVSLVDCRQFADCKLQIAKFLLQEHQMAEQLRDTPSRSAAVAQGLSRMKASRSGLGFCPSPSAR